MTNILASLLLLAALPAAASDLNMSFPLVGTGPNTLTWYDSVPVPRVELRCGAAACVATGSDFLVNPSAGDMVSWTRLLDSEAACAACNGVTEKAFIAKIHDPEDEHGAAALVYHRRRIIVLLGFVSSASAALQAEAAKAATGSAVRKAEVLDAFASLRRTAAQVQTQCVAFTQPLRKVFGNDVLECRATISPPRFEAPVAAAKPAPQPAPKPVGKPWKPSMTMENRFPMAVQRAPEDPAVVSARLKAQAEEHARGAAAAKQRGLQGGDFGDWLDETGHSIGTAYFGAFAFFNDPKTSEAAGKLETYAPLLKVETYGTVVEHAVILPLLRAIDNCIILPPQRSNTGAGYALGRCIGSGMEVGTFFVPVARGGSIAPKYAGIGMKAEQRAVALAAAKHMLAAETRNGVPVIIDNAVGMSKAMAQGFERVPVAYLPAAGGEPVKLLRMSDMRYPKGQNVVITLTDDMVITKPAGTDPFLAFNRKTGHWSTLIEEGPGGLPVGHTLVDAGDRIVITAKRSESPVAAAKPAASVAAPKPTAPVAAQKPEPSVVAAEGAAAAVETQAAVPVPPAAGAAIPRAAGSAARVPEDVLRGNAALQPAERAAAAQSQLGLSPAKANAVLAAHEKFPCAVGRCSAADLRGKVGLMRAAGMTDGEVRGAIERGLAGMQFEVDRAVVAAALRDIEKNPPRWLMNLPPEQRAQALARIIVDAGEDAARASGLTHADQYFTIQVRPVEHALAANPAALAGTKYILEVGAGTGNITSIVQRAAGQAKVVVFEADAPALSALKLTADQGLVEVMPRYFGVKDLEDLVRRAGGPQGVGVIMNPPYFLIPDIVEALDRLGIENAIMYGPKRLLEGSFGARKGWRVLDALGANDFYPFAPTTTKSGAVIDELNHVVVCRGAYCPPGGPRPGAAKPTTAPAAAQLSAESREAFSKLLAAADPQLRRAVVAKLERMEPDAARREVQRIIERGSCAP